MIYLLYGIGLHIETEELSSKICLRLRKML